jgi:hypothetical protein
MRGSEISPGWADAGHGMIRKKDKRRAAVRKIRTGERRVVMGVTC